MNIKKVLQKFTQTHYLFALIALVFGAVFIFTTPPLWGPDENLHFTRVYQISVGNISNDKVNINGQLSAGGGLTESMIKWNDLRESDIAANRLSQKHVSDISKYVDIGTVPLSKDKVVVNAFGGINYPLAIYTTPALGSFIASKISPNILSMLYSARFMILALYITIIFIALYITRKSSVKWLVFFVALLPSSLYQASVVGADYLLIALSLLLFACFYHVSKAKNVISLKYIITITVTGILIVLIKPPYIPILFILPFLKLDSKINNKAKILLKLVIPLLCLIVSLFVVLGFGANEATSISPPNTDLVTQLGWIIHHPLGYIKMIMNSILSFDWMTQAIGLFGCSFIFIPNIIFCMFLAGLAVTTFIDTDGASSHTIGDSKFSSIAYIFMGIGSCIAVMTTLYLTWTSIGGDKVSGVQGRYFIPVFIFIIFGIRSLTNLKIRVSDKKARVIYLVFISTLLLVSVAWYYKTLY